MSRPEYDTTTCGAAGTYERCPRRFRRLRRQTLPAPDGQQAVTVVERDGRRIAALVHDESLADDPALYFTTPHFDGYAVILTRLDRATADDLDELLVESWLTRAPKRLAKAYLAAR